MHRIATTAVTLIAALCGSVALAYNQWGTTATEEGRRNFQHRIVVEQLFSAPLQPEARNVVFMGDSTMMGGMSWSRLVIRGLRRHGITGFNNVYPGQDLFHHYCTIGLALAAKPDLVVILANNRAMYVNRRRGASMSMCSAIPPSQLIRSFSLPFHDRGISLIRLALIQTLRYEPVVNAMYFLEGLRRQAAALWLDRTGAPGTGTAEARRDIPMFDHLLWPSHPHVRMLSALVEEVRRNGAHPLVVVAPIPPFITQVVKAVEPVHSQRNHDVLQRAVEDAGGELIDLHDFLQLSSFRDPGGHPTRDGHVQMFNRLAFRIHDILGLPPPTAPVLRSPTVDAPSYDNKPGHQSVGKVGQE